MAKPELSEASMRQAVALVDQYGTPAAASRASGIAPSTLSDHYRRAKEKGYHLDPAIKDSMAAVGTNMVPHLAWAKTKSEDGTSYSILLKPPQEGEADILERLSTAFEGIQPAKPVIAPKQVMSDLCTLYPLMDVHLGLKAWALETRAADYDLNIAVEDMHYAFAKVTAITPDSKEAVLAVGGDFFHADDENNQTPQSKHNLDVDGRHFKVLDVGIQLLSSVIETLLAKHERVTIRVLRGNHDIHAHLVLTFALFERYRNEPRLEIEKDPHDLFMKQWGNCLIAAHHGDKAKPDRLKDHLSDMCPYWSATRHRFLFTGHIHHDSAKDFGSLKWESLRAFCPPDSYAAGMKFASRRALQAITFHKVDGLILRAIDPIERAA